MQLLSALVFALLASTCMAVPTESNSQRLARGLPPLPPKFGRTLPGFARMPDVGTPAFGAKRSVPSSTPPTTYSGHIEVRNKQGAVLGHVKNWSGQDPVNGINLGDPTQDLAIQFTTFPSNPVPFDISATNAHFTTPFFIGLAGHDSLGLGSANTVFLTNGLQTPPNSGPVNGFESAVWSFNTITKELTVQWVNPDETKPKTIIGYDIRENQFIVTGDLDEWEHEHPDFFADPVRFFLAN